ncbi:MAG: glycosyltransferase family 4 protein [Nanoarchaeota archaeon]|nr:glycosyltransferase family 4 protein [Nanoarchaeota archaeon]
MKNIKVYLQRPWKFADSPYYQYLLGNPPKGITYIGQNQKKGTYSNRWKFIFLRETKFLIRRIFRIVPIPFPNAHLTKSKEKYDLIHCAHCLSLNNRPWITDTEWVGQFWLAANHEKHPNRRIVKKILMNDNCKKILAWTEWSKKGILKEFPEVKDKVELIYPGIPVQKMKKNKTDKVRLLFGSRAFYFKGGLYALEVIDRMTKKYDNVEGIIISDVPAKVVKKYSKNKKIKFHNLIPQKKFFKEIYPNTDILIYPSFTDTFGFHMTEAMSFGIPVVTASGTSRKEIVRNGKTGFVIESGIGESLPKGFLENLERYGKIIDRMCLKVSKLIEDKDLRERMSKAAYEEISIGRFSIKKMQEKLIKVYRESI